jgi:hypothetical protein
VELAEVLANVAADIAADVADRTELEVFNSLRLSVVLLLAVHCWDSLES